MYVYYKYLYVSSVLMHKTSGGLYGNHSFRRCTRLSVLRDSPKSHSLTREKSDRQTNTLSNLTSR